MQAGPDLSSSRLLLLLAEVQQLPCYQHDLGRKMEFLMSFKVLHARVQIVTAFFKLGSFLLQYARRKRAAHVRIEQSYCSTSPLSCHHLTDVEIELDTVLPSGPCCHNV